MNSTIAIDANVLIYACDKAHPDRQRIALDLIDRSVDGALLWQVACEFIAASRKLAPQGFTATAVFPLILPGKAVLERARTLHARDRDHFEVVNPFAA